MKYILLLEAYAKIMLHVHKYPSFQVHGVLLGKEEDSNVNIVDSVPLFHGQLLAPLSEVALTMVCNIIWIHLSLSRSFATERDTFLSFTALDRRIL